MRKEEVFNHEYWNWEDCEGGGSDYQYPCYEGALQSVYESIPKEEGCYKRAIRHFVVDSSRDEGWREIEEDWDLHIFRDGVEVEK